MFNFSFVCRKSKAGRNGLAPIELSIIINGERTYITLPQKANPSTFSRDIASRKNNDIQDYLSAVRIKLNSIINKMMMDEEPITALSIKNAFTNGTSNSHTIKRVCNEFCKQYQNKVEVGEAANGTFNKYLIAIDRFIEYFGDTKEISSIKSNDIINFKLHIKKTYNYNDTTVALYLSKIKTIITFAHNNGYITINPFANIKIGKREKEVEYLTQDEVDIIAHHQFIGRLENIRDLFVFACNTGLSYSDMSQLSKMDIKQAEGVYYVKKPRIKTSVIYTAILNDTAMEILRKYNYQLPVISN
uniref:phage integrase SAM-like domain-containing protein n=1 Tax=Alistipes sp. TaxID=1872444 RepID=UPI003A8B0CB2